VRDRPDDLIVAIAVSLLLVLFIDFAPTSPIRLVLGLIFLLILPGYVVMAAIFPDKRNIDMIERVALSVGLSVAIVPLTGLAIYTIFATIEFMTLVTAITAFVIIVSFIAWLRKLNIPADERYSIDIAIDLSPSKMPPIDRALVVGIAAAIIVIIVMLAFIASAPSKRGGYSEISITDRNGDIRGYPLDLTIGQVGSLKVSVFSQENTKTNYSLVILLQEENHTGQDITHWRNGDPFIGEQTFNSGLAMAYNFSLNPQEYMNSSFDFKIYENGTFKLSIMLFYEGQNIEDEPPYQNWIWLYVRTVV